MSLTDESVSFEVVVFATVNGASYTAKSTYVDLDDQMHSMYDAAVVAAKEVLEGKLLLLSDDGLGTIYDEVEGYDPDLHPITIEKTEVTVIRANKITIFPTV